MNPIATWTTPWVEKFVERYPVQAGVIVVLIGLGFITAGFMEAARYDEFDGGSRVVGRVISAGDDPDRAPRFAAEATWVTDGQLPSETVQHQAIVEILSRQLPSEKALDPVRRLHPGSELPLVLSTINPDVAISAAVLDDAYLLKVAGRNVLAIPLAIGLICFVGGLVGARAGARKRRAPPSSH